MAHIISKIFYNISEDESGVMTKIKLRSGEIIDHIQAFYEGGRAGEGGVGYIISDLDNSSKYIVVANLIFGVGLLGTIKFIFNDGIMGGGGKIKIHNDFGENVAHIAFNFQH
ncbi:hypothetical protein RhiirB3_523978 [Rhizophagus irregularis]|nr:hypothetical protein RhiirB3_523978 [Rhizophagus irregularis]